LGDVVLPIELRDPRQQPDEEFVYVDIAAIDNTTKSIVSPTAMLGKDAPSRARKVIRSGDILVSTVRPNLNAVAMVPPELDGQICSTGFSVLRPASELLSGYLFNWVRSAAFVETLESLTTGANYPAVSDKDVKGVEIPIPPMSEQERIVRLLDEANAIRNLRAQADQRTADLIPALFHQMFGDPVTNPMGWPVKALSEVIAGLQGGKNVNPAPEGEPGGKYRVLKVSAVTTGSFAPNESKPVPADYQPPSSHFISKGDVLFSRANTSELVGATCNVDGDYPNLLLPDKIWRLVWMPDSPVEPLYILHLLQSKPIRRELSRLASGTGGSMKNISQAKLFSLDIPVPPLVSQERFADLLASVDLHQSLQARARLSHRAMVEALTSEVFTEAV
jgi:type I restriction enzyme S subunit